MVADVRLQMNHRRQRVQQPPTDLTVHRVGAGEHHRRTIGAVAPGAHSETHRLIQVLAIDRGATLVRMDDHLRRGTDAVSDDVRLRAVDDGDVAGRCEERVAIVGNDPGVPA